MNRKGFTLIELLATILVLAMVMSIGTISIISIIKSSKEKNYNILLGAIKDGCETYYQECKYAKNIACTIEKSEDGDDVFTTSLGYLVEHGYLKGNSTINDKSNEDNDNKYTLVNPINDKPIFNCNITVKVDKISKKITVTAVPGNNPDCPQDYASE